MSANAPEAIEAEARCRASSPAAGLKGRRINGRRWLFVVSSPDVVRGHGRSCGRGRELNIDRGEGCSVVRGESGPKEAIDS